MVRHPSFPPSTRRCAVLALVLLVVGCSRGTPTGLAAPPEPAPAPRPVADCTLETPLDPTVPGSPGHPIAVANNSNGISELALLMRTMRADLEAARGLVVQGQAPPPMLPTHRRIRCAWPTTPSDRNAGFDALAQTYLERVGTLDRRQGDLKAAYEGVVRGCLGCHAEACPGPIPVIEQLALPGTAP